MTSPARALPPGFVRPSTDPAVPWVVELLVRRGLSVVDAEERARNLLGTPDPRWAAEDMLRGHVSDAGMRRHLGRRVGQLRDAVRAGWCDEALESLITGFTVTLEVRAATEPEAHDAVGKQYPGLSTAGTRCVPQRAGPARWRVKCAPLGRFTHSYSDGVGARPWKGIK